MKLADGLTDEIVVIKEADGALADALIELRVSTAKYGTFHTSHEGFGVIHEEEEELWEAVRANNLEQMEKEAIQLAAMALRMVIDVRRTLKK